MAVNAVELWPQTVLTTIAAQLMLAPVGSNGYMLKRAVFTNTSAGAVTITVNKVPNGGAVAAGNVITSVYSIPAGQAFVPPELINLVIPAGGSLWALASIGSVVNTTGSGFSF